MSTESNYPTNLYAYFDEHRDRFEEKTNMAKKIIYYLLLALCVLLIIIPGIIPLSVILVRIAAGIGIIVFGLAAFFGGKEYYNKNGGKIKDIVRKKFNSSMIDEATILQMFENNDFEGLSEAPHTNNQPIQLYIDEDEKGKEFYCQIMKFFSQSDFRGITEVKVIREPEYSKLRNTVKDIQSTE